MATRTWDNGAATQNWEDADNWSGNTVPVTGDTAIIPTGMGTIAGTPSADVLALVQVEGDTALNVTLEATALTFEGTSYNNGIITGTCTFNDSSYNNGGVTGDCAFNDNSRNAGTITGNTSFTNTNYSSAANVYNPQQGTVSGTVDFPNGATFTLAASED